MQPGSSFTPLVIGPEQIPRVSLERARRQPWLAVLSALAHGNGPVGVSIALAAIEATRGLPDEHAKVCFDRIRSSLNEAAWSALENAMQYRKYEYKSDFALCYVGEGLSGDELRRPIEACVDLGRLTSLFSRINAAPDRRTVERLVAALGPKPARSAAHRRPRTTRPARAPRARAARR